MPRALPALAIALLLSGCADYVFVRGPIEPAMAAEVARRIAGSTASTIVVDLASDGGQVQAGLGIITAMEAVRGRVRLVTRVRDHCHSMCVALFLAGDDRIAEPGARFLLHGVTDLDGVPQPAATVGMVAYYLVRGMDPAWIRAQVEDGRLLSAEPVALSGGQMAELASPPPVSR